MTQRKEGDGAQSLLVGVAVGSAMRKERMFRGVRWLVSVWVGAVCVMGGWGAEVYAQDDGQESARRQLCFQQQARLNAAYHQAKQALDQAYQTGHYAPQQYQQALQLLAYNYRVQWAQLSAACGGILGSTTPPSHTRPHAPSVPPQGAQPQGSNVGVYINDRRISQGILRRYARQGVHIPVGRYWYDRRSGLWGREGGAALGLISSGLGLGGRMRADISNGTSGVLINGRRLTWGEVQFLQRLLQTPIRPGRYWLDHRGYAGYEGGPAITNLRTALVRQRRSQVTRYYRDYGNGSTSYLSNGSFTGISVRSGGKTTSYYFGN